MSAFEKFSLISCFCNELCNFTNSLPRGQGDRLGRTYEGSLNFEWDGRNRGLVSAFEKFSLISCFLPGMNTLQLYQQSSKGKGDRWSDL